MHLRFSCHSNLLVKNKLQDTKIKNSGVAVHTLLTVTGLDVLACMLFNIDREGIY